MGIIGSADLFIMSQAYYSYLVNLVQTTIVKGINLYILAWRWKSIKYRGGGKSLSVEKVENVGKMKINKLMEDGI